MRYTAESSWKKLKFIKETNICHWPFSKASTSSMVSSTDRSLFGVLIQSWTQINASTSFGVKLLLKASRTRLLVLKVYS